MYFLQNLIFTYQTKFISRILIFANSIETFIAFDKNAYTRIWFDKSKKICQTPDTISAMRKDWYLMVV